MRRWLAAALALLPAPAFAQTGLGVGPIATPAVSSALVLKTIPADLYDVNLVSGASAGYMLVFDAKAAPADGAVTPSFCLPVAANTGVDFTLRADPARFVNGIVIVFSTTGCYTKTASATAFISGSAQ